MNSISKLFEGRIGRRAYFIRIIVVELIQLILLGLAAAESPDNNVFSTIIYIVTSAYMVSISVRRLHDMGRHGYLAIFALVPLFKLYLWFKPGEEEENIYGPVPRG